MSIIQSNLNEPLVFLPVRSEPEQLFVLLHGESAAPKQLLPLVRAIQRAFPLSVIVVPCGPVRESASAYWWCEQAGPNSENDILQTGLVVSGLVAWVKEIQMKYGLVSEQTALAGYSQGAVIAVEAGLAHPDLAGRILAFSGRYTNFPAHVPRTTTLHFFHGASDNIAAVGNVKELLAYIAGLQGDVTLDIASKIGHELHAVLINQAIYRLQTCVPLRSWAEALGELDMGTANPGTRTLH